MAQSTIHIAQKYFNFNYLIISIFNKFDSNDLVGVNVKQQLITEG